MEPRWLWPFELIEKIGEGGMGVVYRARYTGNDRQVAVKLLPTEIAADPILLARFERELEVLKQLHHPNIVRCFGGTCESSQHYYAMELVDGGTLADLLQQKGQLPWEFVVDFALQMCEGLNHAHEHGVIHRDVKPGNFLLTKSRQIKLSDFGLASIATTQRLTAAGRTVGTIQYMAPEQIRGKPALTGRADLYALGCVMYEMLTGHPPYRGENAAIVLQQHLSAVIPHAAVEVPQCPLKLDQLICELLSKDADQRPATAAEVGWRLEEILQPGRHSLPVEPDLFSISRTAASPLKNVPKTPSDAGISTVPSVSVPSLLPWGICVLLLLACVGIWLRANATATRLRHAEQQWVDLFQKSDQTTRLLAAQALADFGPLQASTIEVLHEGTRDKTPAIRVAALAALGQHAAECRWLQNEFLHLEKVDENPDVRYQAGMVLDAMKHAPAATATRHVVSGGVMLLVLCGLVAGGWHVWRRLQVVAAS
ncbi:MAG: protein kinase [Planctomycetes bacterium]|nr:protein kinase [Planctomycetota bacterium]